VGVSTVTRRVVSGVFVRFVAIIRANTLRHWGAREVYKYPQRDIQGRRRETGLHAKFQECKGLPSYRA
jgi:hypothetical protein